MLIPLGCTGAGDILEALNDCHAVTLISLKISFADFAVTLCLPDCRQMFTLLPGDNIVGLLFLPLQPGQLNNGIPI